MYKAVHVVHLVSDPFHYITEEFKGIYCDIEVNDVINVLCGGGWSM